MKRQGVSFPWISTLSADAPDHLQPRPAALGRIEHQLVHQVADHGEAKSTMLPRLTRKIRYTETAAGIRDAYLHARRQDLVLDLVALHRGVADHVGHRLRNGELEVVDLLRFESCQTSGLAHHQTGQQHILWAA